MPRVSPWIVPVLLACLAACRSDGPPSGESIRVESVGNPRELVVHPVYQAAFDAVKAALDAEETAVAQSTLTRLRTRLTNDRRALPTFREAQESNSPLASQVLSGELPSRESVDAGLRIADGFGRVIEGRLRMDALELSLELVRGEGETMELVLAARSDWRYPLTLRPGPALLRVRRTSLEPRSGDLAVDYAELALDGLVVLEVPAGGEARTALAEIPIEVPVGAIATETRARVVFNGGLVVERGESYPAREATVGWAARTDYPSWVPLGYLEPEALVTLIARGNAPLPAILEHTVRIAPPRRDEALDRLAVALETLPPHVLRPVLPALRWLSGDLSLDLDDRGWKAWLADRLERRRAEGLAVE